ncbi:MAG: calcineurin-like phosphoesterase C-terminal domain-containing protein [Bacteroidales bacterium]|nr:calcineurin-like phosphoesterase C-terminal domain-containing protein [Bacteroidales bacterium]MCB9014131.1 calcineurin-like phosphoesterase C-terminal domain-containing protein [Bacteroidales bacterium]
MIKHKKDNKKGNQKDAFRYALRLLTLFILISGLGLGFQSCNNEPDPEPDNGLKITGVSIPSELNVKIGEQITITGKGFAMGDQIKLTSTSDVSIVFVCDVLSLTDQSVTFALPNNVNSGSYQIKVLRNPDSQLLGSFLLNIVADTNIPDIEGMTIKGVVYCNGIGIPDVAVSDGIEVTTTDAKGVYYLPSLKENAYVFISVPGNYEVYNTNNLPIFFKRLSGGATVEQKDFSLIETNNDKHIVVTMADWHLANRNDDLSQFTNGFLYDVNNTIDYYQSQGTKVYGLTLGDMSWDLYWYSNKFALPEYLVQMYKLNCTVFNVMGNHDNNPYALGDWLAEDAFKKTVCPNYYSFNLGAIHYVVLDDIQYINTGGSEGVVGDRNFDNFISSEQMAWLKKDLATVKDKNAPLIVAMHAPLYRNPNLDVNGNQTSAYALDNATDLVTALNDFTNVHVLSGHLHVNFSVEEGHIMEHNTAAVCATWWWTGKNGYAGNHLCKDGSPGGYGVWEIDGNNVEWYYKSVGKPMDYQFRTYDLNMVHITAENFAPNASEAAMAEYSGTYADASAANEVLINVWGYEPEWVIEVKEGGLALNVTPVYTMDPLHIISYEALRLNAGAVPTSAFITDPTAHLFKVTATGPATSLEIKVTDRFGNIYTETMTRPKEFTYLMN